MPGVPPAADPPETGRSQADGGSVGRLSPPWLVDPRIGRVVTALTAGGADVRFVGGCVRDSLLGVAVKDIDIATPEPPDLVIRRGLAAGLRVVPTGLDHGTVTVIADHQPVEVTTLRRDVGTDGRRAVVAFTDDWAEDAARRDFTVNALSLTPDGRLFDPVGGVADLRAGRVRFIGSPAARIAEDRLRVLRLFRFHARFGRQPPDAGALAACRAAAGTLDALSGERIAAELTGLLATAQPGAAVRLMIETGVLPAVLPVARPMARPVAVPAAATEARLRALVAVEGIAVAGSAAGADPIRRLAILLPADAGPGGDDRPGTAGIAAATAARLRLSRTDGRHLAALVATAPLVGPALSLAAHRAAAYRVGPAVVRDRLLLAWARHRAVAGRSDRGDTDAWRDRIARVRHWLPPGAPPRLPVGGRDLLALGVPRGPAIGRLLAAVEAWWIDADFRPDRDACLAVGRRLAADAARPARTFGPVHRT